MYRTEGRKLVVSWAEGSELPEVCGRRTVLGIGASAETVNEHRSLLWQNLHFNARRHMAKNKQN